MMTTHIPRRWALFTGTGGILALAVSAWIGLHDPKQFAYSYLVSWLFYVSLALGALFFVLVQFAVRAGWSVATRRIAEHTMATLIILTALFVPVLLGLEHIYAWAGSEAATRDSLLQHKRTYLNSGSFYFRSLLYLVGWSTIAWWFRARSVRQDLTAEPAITRKLQSASAPALAWFGVTVTFASFDWIMSLEPHWYSTIFGVYFFSGCVVGSLGIQILLLAGLQRLGLLTGWIKADHFHDLGKLFFGFVIFWAYIAFSQFLLIWYANLPEETSFYAFRFNDGWMRATLVLLLGHFLLPFFLLLSREAKRNPLRLAAVAAWVLAMHYLDIYWLVMPTLHGAGVQFRLLDFTTFVGIGGLWLGSLLFLMGRVALVPIRDPRLSESLAFENS